MSIFDHSLLRNIINSRYNQNYEGICYGSAHMAAPAMLLDDEGIQTFNKRLKSIFEKIHDDSIDNFLNLNTELKDTLYGFKNQDNTAEKIDITAFLDGIALTHTISDFPQLFNKNIPTIQSAKLATPFIISNKLEQVGALEYSDSFSGIYNQNELIDYFRTLQELFYNIPDNSKPFVMTLISGNHAITVGYSFKQKKWLFFDVNNMPIKYISGIGGIAKKVMHAFFATSLDPNNYVAFATQPIFTAENRNLYEKIKTQWYRDLEVKHTQFICDKATRIDTHGFSLLYVAAHNGHAVLVKNLLTHNELDPNIKNHDDWTPLHIAAYHGHADIIKNLLAHEKIKLNIKNNNGHTALYIATAKGHADIVEKLLKHNNYELNFFELFSISTENISDINIPILAKLILNYSKSWLNTATKLYSQSKLTFFRAFGSQEREDVMQDTYNRSLSPGAN